MLEMVAETVVTVGLGKALVRVPIGVEEEELAVMLETVVMAVLAMVVPLLVLPVLAVLLAEVVVVMVLMVLVWGYMVKVLMALEAVIHQHLRVVGQMGRMVPADSDHRHLV